MEGEQEGSKPTKRGGPGQETSIAKVAELYRIMLGEGKRSPAPGLERFKIGGRVRSTGKSHRY